MSLYLKGNIGEILWQLVSPQSFQKHWFGELGAGARTHYKYTAFATCEPSHVTKPMVWRTVSPQTLQKQSFGELVDLKHYKYNALATCEPSNVAKTTVWRTGSSQTLQNLKHLTQIKKNIEYFWIS